MTKPKTIQVTRNSFMKVGATTAAALLFTLLAQSADAKQLIDVGFASNDHVYFWYADNGGEVSSGLTNRPTHYRVYYGFNRPGGETLLASAVTKGDNRSYYWWRGSDGKITVSSGTTNSPYAHSSKRNFNRLPATAGPWAQDLVLVAAGIARNDHVYFYWKARDGRIYVSAGTSQIPARHWGPVAVEGATTQQYYDLLGVGIAASDDHVYYWWKNKTSGEVKVTSGTSRNPFQYRDAYSANMP
jgi:hypothetical protein